MIITVIATDSSRLLIMDMTVMDYQQQPQQQQDGGDGDAIVPTRTTKSTISETFAPFAPQHAVYSWLIINSILFVWSTVLAVQILNDTIERDHLYLVWNFGTTIVWCIEVGLTLASNGEEDTTKTAEELAEEGYDWETNIELIVAIRILN